MALLVGAAAPAHAADEIHWTITGPTSVTFDWHGTASENTIRYGLAAGAYTLTVVASNPAAPNIPFDSPGPFWEARITGLQADTLYHYSVAGGPDHTFRTPPPRGSTGEFIVYAEGDVGESGSYDNMPIVQSLITDADFVLLAGDISYANVHDLTALNRHFNDVMVWSQDAAYMPAWGNHESDDVLNTCGLTCGSACPVQECDDLRNYKGRFDFPNPQTSPGSPAVSCCGEDWSWFDYGHVRFISYPEPWSGAWSDWDARATALMDEAQADPAVRFIVTFGHRPAYSSGAQGGSPTLKGYLDRLGANHNKYILNVNGHSHNYERTYPQNGVVHLTVGTGGANFETEGVCLWPVCPGPSWSAFRAMYHGVTRLRFTETGIEGSFICGPPSSANDINGTMTTCTIGSVIDAFTIGTAPDTVPPNVSLTAPATGAVLSGPVSVAAFATDNAGVVGVRFLLDGVDLGAEDTLAPYSILWDTTTVIDGPYTLTAVARDAVGNTTTSSPVGVFVNNAGVFFVDGSSPDCANGGAGTSTQPYCTITAAANARGGPGTTVYVAPGIYREQITVNASGASGSPFVFKALGPGVVLDGADDFSATSKWTNLIGDVWLAASVAWSPKQVFADGARLAASGAAPSLLPARTFRYVAGEGLYVNAGGGNPGAHQALVGRRLNGFRLTGRSWVTIDGFTVTRTEDRAIRLSGSSNNTRILDTTVAFANSYGIYVTSSAGVLIRGCVASDNNDHGFYLSTGTTGSTVEDSEAFRNARPGSVSANGLRLSSANGNVIRGNRFHDNQDTGQNLSSSSDNLSIQNRSWNNGDRGFDDLNSPRTQHVHDVAWGNLKEGFMIGGTSTNSRISNSIAVDNGLTTGRYDLQVESGSVSGFASDYNIFWNSNGQTLIRYNGVKYTTLAAFRQATGHDARSLQADPRFLDPAQGNFHLTSISPAIDSADSSVPNWPASDAAGEARVDDPGIANTGNGPVPYADRGALEFRPAGHRPIADLTVSPAAGTAPLTVSLDASGSADPDGTITSYLFDFGDFQGAGPQPDPVTGHTYDFIGNWTARVTVTDDDGQTDAAEVLVMVTTPNLSPQGTIDTPTTGVTITTGQVVTFTGTGSDPDGNLPLSYVWSFGGGAPDVATEDPGPVAFNTPGTYTVTLTVTDSLGLADPTPDARTITVMAPNEAPNGVIDLPAGDVTVAEGESVVFNGSGADPDGNTPLSYLWNFSGGAANRSEEDPGAVVFSIPGTYTVTFTVTDGLGLSDPTPDGRVITVSDDPNQNQAPNGVIDLPAGNATILAGEAVVFSATGVDPDGNLPLSYLWNFGGGAPDQAVEDPGAVAFDTPGTYTVTFTVTDGLGLSDPTPDGRVVTVAAPNQAPDGVIDLPAGDVAIDAGQPVQFNGSGTDPDGNVPLSYLWDFGGGANNSTDEDPGVVVFNSPGTYTVTLTVSDSLGLADPTPASRTMTVNPSSNLVTNPSFEIDTEGWTSYGSATLQRVAGGKDGAFSLEMRGPATTGMFGVNDHPNAVASTPGPGTRYRFTAWVMSPSSTGQARLRVREWVDSVRVGSITYSPAVTLSPTWQAITVDYVITTNGSYLDLQVQGIPLVAGDVFRTDDISIRIVP